MLPKRPIAGRARDVLFLIVLVALAAACTSPGGPPAPGAGDTAAQDVPVEPRQCETEGFPCSLAGVAAETLSKSTELGRAAADQLRDGSSTVQIAAWLEDQPDVAVVAHDDDVVRFRLDGGRFHWIVAGPGDATAASGPRPAGHARSPIAPPSAPPFYSVRRDAGTTEGPDDTPPTIVVNEGESQKRATVLSPYEWHYHTNLGGSIAGILQDTRGYENGVTHLVNATETDATVSASSYARLADQDVVVFDTPNVSVCNEETPPGCWGVIVAHQVHGTDSQIVDQLNAAESDGMDWIHWEQGSDAVGLSADFFLEYYPGGLRNALVVIAGASLDDANLLKSIAGPGSEIFNWEGERDPDAAAAVIEELITRLSNQGRTTAAVYEDLGEARKVGDAVLVANYRHPAPPLRIREVAWLRDAAGDPLQDGASLTIDGAVDDGRDDTVGFVVDVDGVSPEDAAKTTVIVKLDDVVSDAIAVSTGDHVDEYRWRITDEVIVPDLHDGQELTMTAVVSLPEGGTSTHAVKVVADGSPDIGTVWKGTATTRSESPYGPHVTRSVAVTLVRDPDQKPDAKHVRFLVSEGVMTWTLDGSDQDGCSYTAATTTVTLPPGEFPALTFHREISGSLVTYDAAAEFEGGPRVEVRKDCPGLGSVDYSERAEGMWFYAPRELELAMTGTTISGGYTQAAGKPIARSFEWSFTRVK